MRWKTDGDRGEDPDPWRESPQDRFMATLERFFQGTLAVRLTVVLVVLVIMLLCGFGWLGKRLLFPEARWISPDRAGVAEFDEWCERLDELCDERDRAETDEERKRIRERIDAHFAGARLDGVEGILVTSDRYRGAVDFEMKVGDFTLVTPDYPESSKVAKQELEVDSGSRVVITADGVEPGTDTSYASPSPCSHVLLVDVTSLDHAL